MNWIELNWYRRPVISACPRPGPVVTLLWSPLITGCFEIVCVRCEQFLTSKTWTNNVSSNIDNQKFWRRGMQHFFWAIRNLNPVLLWKFTALKSQKFIVFTRIDIFRKAVNLMYFFEKNLADFYRICVNLKKLNIEFFVES